MTLIANGGLSAGEVDRNLRRAADLIAEASALVQAALENSAELYELCTELDNHAADLEVLADDLEVRSIWG
jgi:hypothetical protein